MNAKIDNLRYASGDIHLDHHSNDDRILYEASLDEFKSFPKLNEYLRVRIFGLVLDLEYNRNKNNNI